MDYSKYERFNVVVSFLLELVNGGQYGIDCLRSRVNIVPCPTMYCLNHGFLKGLLDFTDFIVVTKPIF